MPVMRVWQAYTSSGDIRKTWAACIEGRILVTRWGPGNSLASKTSVELKGATPSAKLSEMEREKRGKGYDYLGEFQVSDDGKFITPVAQARPEPPPRPTAFLTVTTKYLLSAIDDLAKAGFKVDSENGIVSIGYANSVLRFPEDDRVIAGLPANEVNYHLALAMMYLAKQGGGGLANQKGEPMMHTLGALEDLFGKAESDVREKAEQLGLAPRAFAKSLTSKSGLFSFGGSKQQPT